MVPGDGWRHAKRSERSTLAGVAVGRRTTQRYSVSSDAEASSWASRILGESGSKRREAQFPWTWPTRGEHPDRDGGEVAVYGCPSLNPWSDLFRIGVMESHRLEEYVGSRAGCSLRAPRVHRRACGFLQLLMRNRRGSPPKVFEIDWCRSGRCAAQPGTGYAFRVVD